MNLGTIGTGGTESQGQAVAPSGGVSGIASMGVVVCDKAVSLSTAVFIPPAPSQGRTEVSGGKKSFGVVEST